MKDFEDTLETKSKASLEEITECAVNYRKIQMSLGPLVADPEPSRNQIRKIQQECLLESDSNPAITNARREEALGDPYNAISNVVIAMAIMAATESRPNERFHPQNVIYFEAIAKMIGQPQGRVKGLHVDRNEKNKEVLGTQRLQSFSYRREKTAQRKINWSQRIKRSSNFCQLIEVPRADHGIVLINGTVCYLMVFGVSGISMHLSFIYTRV